MVSRVYRKKKKRSTSRSSKRGGSIIGTGSYGCVYHPNLRTDTNNTEDLRYVSKVVSRSSFHSEYDKKLIEILLRIDPHQHYTVYPVGTGIIQDTPNNHRQLKTCEYVPSTCGVMPSHDCITRNFREITFKYSGIDLGTYVDRIMNAKLSTEAFNTRVRNLIAGLRNVLVGIQKIQRAGIIHRDLSAYNIIVRESVVNPIPLCLIIDFGLCIRMGPNPTPSDIKERFERYSPYRLLNDRRSMDYEYIGHTLHNATLDPLQVEDTYGDIYQNPLHELSTFERFYQELTDKTTPSLQDVHKASVLNMDLYSFGFLFNRICKRLQRAPNASPTTRDMLSRLRTTFIPRIVQVNPLQRISPTEAIEEYGRTIRRVGASKSRSRQKLKSKRSRLPWY